MYKVVLILVCVLLIQSWGMGAVVKNPAQPLKGEWNCKTQKSWVLDEIGNEVLVKISHMEIEPNGTLYIGDAGRKKFYLLDSDGKLVHSFGRDGEGPGEFIWLNDFFIIDDNLIVPDAGKVHVFSKKGKFIRDMALDTMLFYWLFVDEKQVVKWCYPPFQKRKESNGIELYNLETKKGKRLADLDTTGETVKYSEGGARLAFRIKRALPTAVFAVDSTGLFYGNNDRYQINKIDFNGNVLFSFAVEGRKKNRVFEEGKRRHFKYSARNFHEIPRNAVNEMLKQIPDESPYFHRLLIDQKGRIYVLLIDLEQQNKQPLDIFSPEGKLLYNSTIDLSRDFERIIELAFSFPREELFVFAEDKEGERRLAKYKINLPD